MRCRLLLILIVHLLPLASSAADDPEVDSRFTFLPGRTLVHPFVANYNEPRVGLRKEIGSSHLKIDIGSSLDVLEYTVSSEKSKKVRAGVDFFTYALSTSAEGRRLQIDAVDGLFGGHLSYQAVDEERTFSLRLRIIHSSAHFIDGHFDNTTGTWKNGIAPIPFTRDFIELAGAVEHQWSSISLMAYSGFSYAMLIRPENIKRASTIHGFEARTTNALGTAMGKPFSLFFADNLSLVGIPKYIGTNNLELGVKFGEWAGSGVRLYISYYSGLTVFSQYYNIREEQWGLGFTFDVW
ncbi:MAG: hypothetical protein HW412_982 [Bacteroidetes bacterium]|nr:hypothetical protein [Bacteroidota bacterium]